MAKFHIDWEFFDQECLAAGDPDAAAKALLIFCNRVRQLPGIERHVVDYVVGAIEAAMILPQKKRGPALLRNLKLTAGNRRPLNRPHDEIFMAVEHLLSSGQGQNAAVSQVAVDFETSESSVLRSWKQGLVDREAHRAMLHEEGYC